MALRSWIQPLLSFLSFCIKYHLNLIFQTQNTCYTMSSSSLLKHLPSSQSRNRFKKQCLKAKNILFQNDQLQLGCKVHPLYDFYSSCNYLQINLFVGNKTDNSIQNFKVEFRGSSNLEVYGEEKGRSIKGKTQYKERLVVGCNNYEEEILLLMDFQSSLVTLKNTPIPLTLFSFLIFSKSQPLPASIQSESDLTQLLHHKYEYIQEQQMVVTSPLFRKNILVQIQKYVALPEKMSKICDGVYLGYFTTKTLVNQYALVVKVISQKNVKISIGSNQYLHFEQIFGNIKFLLE